MVFPEIFPPFNAGVPRASSVCWGEKVREMPVTYIGNWYFPNFFPPSVQACLELQVTDIYLGIQPFVGGKMFGKSQLLNTKCSYSG